jgi:hypothetical protein
MLTKTKIALVAALIAGSASLASAQGFDPNLANRYPAYASPDASAQTIAPRGTLRSAPVRLNEGRNVGLTNDQSEIDVDRADRASSPYAGGGY